MQNDHTIVTEGALDCWNTGDQDEQHEAQVGANHRGEHTQGIEGATGSSEQLKRDVQGRSEHHAEANSSQERGKVEPAVVLGDAYGCSAVRSVR